MKIKRDTNKLEMAFVRSLFHERNIEEIRAACQLRVENPVLGKVHMGAVGPNEVMVEVLNYYGKIALKMDPLKKVTVGGRAVKLAAFELEEDQVDAFLADPVQPNFVVENSAFTNGNAHAIAGKMTERGYIITTRETFPEGDVCHSLNFTQEQLDSLAAFLSGVDLTTLIQVSSGTVSIHTSQNDKVQATIQAGPDETKYQLTIGNSCGETVLHFRSTKPYHQFKEAILAWKTN